MTLQDARAQGCGDADNVYDACEAPPGVETLAEDFALYHAWDDEPECERAAIARAWAEGWHAVASQAWARSEAERIATEAADA